MALFNTWSSSWIESRAVARIQTLSERTYQKFRNSRLFSSIYFARKLKGVVGFLFVILSGILGWFSYDFTKREIIAFWERTHFPSDRVIDFTLKNYGLRILSDLNDQQKVMRSLPASLDSQRMFWVTKDLEWVAYFKSMDDPWPLLVFCRLCTGNPVNWQPTQSGWTGFEELIHLFDSKRSDIREFKKLETRKVKVWKDPREIRY